MTHERSFQKSYLANNKKLMPSDGLYASIMLVPYY